MYDFLPVLPRAHFPSVFWPCDRGYSFSTRYIFWILSLRDLAFCRKKQVSGGFGLPSVLVIFRTLDSSSFCMGKTFDLLLNSSRSLPYTSSVVRSSSGLVLSAVISVPSLSSKLLRNSATDKCSASGSPNDAS